MIVNKYIKILSIVCIAVLINNNIHAMEDDINRYTVIKDNVIQDNAAPQPIQYQNIINNNNYLNEYIKDNEIIKLKNEVAKLKLDNALNNLNKIGINIQSPTVGKYSLMNPASIYSGNKIYCNCGSFNSFINCCSDISKKLNEKLSYSINADNNLIEYINNIEKYKNLYKQVNDNLINAPELKSSVCEIITNLEIINEQVLDYKNWHNKINLTDVLEKIIKDIEILKIDYDIMEKCMNQYNPVSWKSSSNYYYNSTSAMHYEQYENRIEEIQKLVSNINNIINKKYNPLLKEYLKSRNEGI